MKILMRGINMGNIHIISDATKNHTKFTVEGSITITDVLNAIKNFYEGDTVTKNVLWDLTNGKAKDIRSSELENIVTLRKGFAHLRNGGKTAILAPADIEFGMSRMVELMTHFKEETIETRVFRTMEDSYHWLLEAEQKSSFPHTSQPS
jgi:hypothetical protein